MKTGVNKPLVLAGDIGGTKTNIGLFYRGSKGPRLKVMEQFSSPQSPDLETIIDRFLTKPKAFHVGLYGQGAL